MVYTRHVTTAILTLGVLQVLPCLAITSYVALGDSYPAGDGAGSSKWLPSLNPLCGRFDKAYPYVIRDRIHDPTLIFENIACGGATSDTAKRTQLRHAEDFEWITIQVGGNQVDFFAVVNECVFQWQPVVGCERELDRARGLVQSTKFIEAFERLVRAATTQATNRSKVLVLGYARFFNETSLQCNNVTFSKTQPNNMLTNELRSTLNGLLIMLNNVLRASAEAHGATYIDIDHVFEGHRFCEDHSIEPQPDNEHTWFFREASETSAMLAKDDTPMQNAIWPNPWKNFTDLTKTFHPTVRGHEEIAREVLQTIREAS